MSEGQIFALILCAFIGWLGAFPLAEPSTSRKAKKLAILWVTLWMAPPLITLYVKAVIG